MKEGERMVDTGCRVTVKRSDEGTGDEILETHEGSVWIKLHNTYHADSHVRATGQGGIRKLRGNRVM